MLVLLLNVQLHRVNNSQLHNLNRRKKGTNQNISAIVVLTKETTLFTAVAVDHVVRSVKATRGDTTQYILHK